jgi:transposase-like protein
MGYDNVPMASKNKAQARSQKGQQVPELTEDQARAHLEKLRWPNGPGCVHCGSVNVTRLNGKAARPGVLQCNDCREQFTVTVGTVLEDSHIPLAKWVKGFHLMCSSKKGISALQLQRNLGLGSYRTAWHMAHRIRYAMKCETAPVLTGKVEVDETYVGGKPRKYSGMKLKHGRGTTKAPVVALVSRDGQSRVHAVNSVDGRTLRSVIRNNVDRKNATLLTDEFVAYRKAGTHFAGGHHTVCHSWGEYARGDIHTNTVESWFALLKRGVVGTFHAVSESHLQRYCDEFAFRWNGRTLTDSERRDAAIVQMEGKRLMYRKPSEAA